MPCTVFLGVEVHSYREFPAGASVVGVVSG